MVVKISGGGEKRWRLLALMDGVGEYKRWWMMVKIIGHDGWQWRSLVMWMKYGDRGH